MTFENDEEIPTKPSMRAVQTPHYGLPKEKQFKVSPLIPSKNFTLYLRY
jgi:hypothetical protein